MRDGEEANLMPGVGCDFSGSRAASDCACLVRRAGCEDGSKSGAFVHGGFAARHSVIATARYIFDLTEGIHVILPQDWIPVAI